MKFKAFLLFFVLLLSNANLTDIRDLYSNVTSSKTKQKEFVAFMQTVNSSESVVQAYKGAAFILQSKNTTDKKEKKELFVKGAELIEKAVSKDSKNIEIRLIRLSVQENLPKALKYNSNIEQDVDFIQKSITTTKDSELKLYVEKYIKQSKSFK